MASRIALLEALAEEGYDASEIRKLLREAQIDDSVKPLTVEATWEGCQAAAMAALDDPASWLTAGYTAALQLKALLARLGHWDADLEAKSRSAADPLVARDAPEGVVTVHVAADVFDWLTDEEAEG